MPVGTPALTDIWRNNLLFRYRAGGNLKRATFTRSTVAGYYAHAGTITTAAANIPRLQWVDLDGDGKRETPGILLNGAGTSVVTDPLNLGAWSLAGTPIRTASQTDPLGGTAAYLLEDDAAGAEEGIFQTVTFTGNGDKVVSLFAKAGTIGAFHFGIFHGAGWRHLVGVTWTAGVPTLGTAQGSGTLFPVESWGNGWYRLSMSASSVVATDTNQIYIRGHLPAAVGTWYTFGVNAWNTAVLWDYTTVADSLTFPFNFGPINNMTVLARIARPTWADASGDVGGTKSVYEIGTTAPHLQLYAASATRDLVSLINTLTTDSQVQTAIPAGTELRVCSQFKNLTTTPQVAHDVGSGMSAFAGAGTAFSAFGNQTLRIGNDLYGTILDLAIFRGLYTREQATAML